VRDRHRPVAASPRGGARFESRVLPLFARRTRAVSALIPELYLHSLAAGDFDLALRGLLGETAPLSARTVARLKARWQGDWELWATRRLDMLEVVYLWVDGVYVKAGLERAKAALRLRTDAAKRRSGWPTRPR
jgi:putative transposase